MSIRLRLTLLLTALFFIAIGNISLIFILESRVEEKLRWVIHTHEVINSAEQLLSTMTDAETGQRGYLLTRDASYLEPYHYGVLSAKEHHATLLRLTVDNADQQKRLNTISELMEKKFVELAETITLMQKGDETSQNESLMIVRKNSGKQYMDEIRSCLRDFNGAEIILLETRKGDFRESRAYITITIALLLVFFVVMGIFTSLFIHKNIFMPMGVLLAGTAKMEEGERQDVSEILPKDEMGSLLCSFYKMSEKVNDKTETLSFKASHDELTGLRNRVGIYREIQNSIVELEQLGTKLAVLFIDLNDFKPLNDTLGHDAGDALLVETARRLEGTVRTDDVVFRHGGDEFVVLIKDVADISGIETIVDNITKRFQAPVLLRGSSITVSLSIGVALAPDDTIGSEELVKFADVAMYAAKKDDTTSCTFFDHSMLKRAGDV